MAYSHFERLSALDDSFLEIEDGASPHAHRRGRDLRGRAARDPRRRHRHRPHPRAHGGGAAPHPALPPAPRVRRRSFDHPVWVDDTASTSPTTCATPTCRSPGDERQLKRLAGRLMSQQLDRGKPLWEMWVVEGLRGRPLRAHHQGAPLHDRRRRQRRADRLGDAADARPDPASTSRRRAGCRGRRRRRASCSLATSCGTGAAAPLAAAARRCARARATRAQTRRSGARRRCGARRGARRGLSARRRRRRSTSTIGPHRRFDWTRRSTSTP